MGPFETCLSIVLAQSRWLRGESSTFHPCIPGEAQHPKLIKFMDLLPLSVTFLLWCLPTPHFTKTFDLLLEEYMPPADDPDTKLINYQHNIIRQTREGE